MEVLRQVGDPFAPVTLIRPPLRIDIMPSVTTIAGMRR